MVQIILHINFSYLPLENLTRDFQRDLRLFNYTVGRRKGQTRETLTWESLYDKLVVTVEWDKEGKSPDYEECESRFKTCASLFDYTT